MYSICFLSAKLTKNNQFAPSLRLYFYQHCPYLYQKVGRRMLTAGPDMLRGRWLTAWTAPLASGQTVPASNGLCDSPRCAPDGDG